MATRARPMVVAAGSLFWAACGDAPDSSRAEETNAHGDAPRSEEAAPAAGKVTRHDDGSLRVRFLDGAFVTWSTEMPVEVEQAIAGEPTQRKVIVWAGVH